MKLDLPSQAILAMPLLVWFSTLFLASMSYAQVTTAITPTTGAGNLGTMVTPPTPGGTVYNITGGFRPGNGNGPNLFHSFGEFTLGRPDTARFLNTTPNLLTSNILARVTGVNGVLTPSSVYGTIDTLTYPSANLFLMNPAGIVFGPNAQLNVGGSVNFTTASYIRLFDGVDSANLYANPANDGLANSVLSVSSLVNFGFLTPAAFGFLSPPDPNTTITVQGSALSVQPGQSISLVGGNVTLQAATLEDGTTQPARLSAPNGQIKLASAESAGEFLVQSLQGAPNINGESFTSSGSIVLSPGSTVDVSQSGMGTLSIRGGQFVLEVNNALLTTAETGPVESGASADNIRLSNGSSIVSATSGANRGADVEIVAENIQMDGVSIGSTTTGEGRSGDISITAYTAIRTNSVLIDSGTGGVGNGGDVTITAGEAQLTNTGINTGDALLFGAGSGGNLTIKADSLKLETVSFATDSLNVRGGDITLEGRDTLNARNITVTGNSVIGVLSLEGESAITVKADRFTMDGVSTLLNQTALGLGGGIIITGNAVELTNGSTILSQTFGDGDAGSIRVTATDHVTFSDNPAIATPPSGLFTDSFGDSGLGTLGNAGAIVVNTPRLEMTGGARMNSTTQSNGGGGEVTITAQSVSISGQRAFEVAQETFGLGGTRASGIYTRTVGSEFCASPCGDAGNVSITTGSLSLSSGAVINSGTTSTGSGGSITVNATDVASISGRLSDGTPGGVFSRTIGTAPDSGKGGDISVTAGHSVTLSNGASISASSTGLGNAGNIKINAGATFLIENSSVTTQATQASGGKISIVAGDMVRLTNSQINTSVADGTGGGGNITIDPNFVILQNSQILAQAFAGQGGNINITTGVFLADASSLVDASSQFGLSGTVTIQSPTSNLSSVWARLQQNYTEAAALLRAACAARVSGQYSSFVQAGRDAVPLEPGGWLLSPLALEGTAVAPPVAQELTGPALASVGLRGFDQNLSWPGLRQMPRRFISILDSACGS